MTDEVKEITDVEEELPKNVVVIAPGKPYERTVEIHEPVGRKNRELMTPLFTFALELMDYGDNVTAMALHALRNKNYERLYVPMALGLNNKEGREWLDNYGTISEILIAFISAVQILMDATGQPAVQEAVKK